MNEPAGGIAEEAAKLFAAAEQWLGDRVGPVSGLAAHQGPECVVCPLCQGLAVLRGARPEVFEHLASAAVSLGLAAKAALDAQERAWARRPAAPVQRIDIG